MLPVMVSSAPILEQLVKISERLSHHRLTLVPITAPGLQLQVPLSQFTLLLMEETTKMLRSLYPPLNVSDALTPFLARASLLFHSLVAWPVILLP